MFARLIAVIGAGLFGPLVAWGVSAEPDGKAPAVNPPPAAAAQPAAQPATAPAAAEATQAETPKAGQPPMKVKTKRIPFLGTATIQATSQQRSEAGLADGVGLAVQYVIEDSPAHQAGLEIGDVLHMLNDQILVNDPQFRVLLRNMRPGDDIQLTLRRHGKTQVVPVRLGEREVPMGDVPARELLQWLLQPSLDGPAGDAPGFVGNYEDNEHLLLLSTGAEGKHLVAKTKQGKVLFDGLINTPEQRGGVPESIRAKLERLETPPKPKTSDAH